MIFNSTLGYIAPFYMDLKQCQTYAVMYRLWRKTDGRFLHLICNIISSNPVEPRVYEVYGILICIAQVQLYFNNYSFKKNK